jgi:membrane protease YdiL (CAAX protease family)
MIVDALTPTVALTFALLLASVLCLWVPYRWAWITAFVTAVVVGTAVGVLDPIAAVPLALYSAAVWWLCRLRSEAQPSTARRGFRILLAGVVAVAAVLFGLHTFPGVHNPIVVRDVVLSTGAAPFSMDLNFDKTAAGLLLMGLCYHGYVSNRKQLTQAFVAALPILLGTVITLLVIAYAVGYVEYDPKVPSIALIWSINNLFFVILSEEAFFRGFILRGLERTLSSPRMALLLSSIAFGLAHFAGGFTYVCFSTLAGLGYGLAYQRSGRIEMAMLAHFAVNATHFFLLTYPRTV